ncbi:response regulator transcription factor [Amycolatopsis palatopharyngis]|uniref:response regulator transcription factor n=1 Tax=Amycolatopsis palatopharyngis TaxID=187982 RepID=UPI001B864122|nr:LuxR C-terminal-related transcriptional regulator [Amycolatopsis palatopharyngis]
MKLSPRRQQVLELLATGATNPQIALALGLSVDTVKTHVKVLLRRLEVVSRAEAVAVGYQRGLLGAKRE